MMFTGIVQGTGSVHSIQGDSTLTFSIEIPSTEGLKLVAPSPLTVFA